MGRHYLIVGSSGFIGSHLAERLRNSGHRVIGIDSIAHPLKMPTLRQPVESLDPRVLCRLVRESDFVFFLADCPSGAISRDDLNRNYLAVRSFVDAANGSGVPILIASSYEIYEQQHGPISEQAPIRPPASYRTVSQILTECLARELRDQAVIARIFPTLGSRFNETYAATIQQMIRHAQSNTPVRISMTGEENLGFLNIDDLIEWLVCLAHTPSVRGGTVNLGSNESYSAARVATEIMSATRSSSELHFASCTDRTEFPTTPVADIGKAVSITGHRPRVSMKATINSLVSQVRFDTHANAEVTKSARFGGKGNRRQV